MSSALSAFNWHGQPSQIGPSLMKPTGSTQPAKDHPLRNGTSSIAAPQKLKRKPGVEKSASV
jgi:hypothetical protein